ncbi:MAG: acyl-CoA dehydrogenase [Planctomycetes bacterium]|nr:acyl-CoA dehydrogenase [Planctomycetota bacterium]
MTLLVVLACVLLAVLLLYHGLGFWAWVLPAFAVLAWCAWSNPDDRPVYGWIGIAVLTLAIVAGLPPVRRVLLGAPLLRLLAPIFPKMSDTERIALEAGTVWWDAELFSGRPNWKRIVEFAPLPLSEKERKFLDGPCKQLCEMIDDNAIRRDGDLPKEVWDFIKREKFMGMIIPEAQGGLGFSAVANSSVVAMLSSRSVTASVTVMVPNSLGPAELLLHYGTEEQKRYYLPKLANGEEVPCFALTEPHAGSDAGGMLSKGVVQKGVFEGKETLGLSLTWNKRYITLAPVATVLGLAFRLYDPDKLLGGDVDRGITCALIPTKTKGVVIGHRHDPLSIPFQNGPTSGDNVFVPIDWIIGGPEMAGQGWRMLMECLSAGRSISLPANSVGGAQLATRVVSAYAAIREQFNMAIGRFEGVEQPVARIGGTMYWMNALRVVTAGSVDAGEKPAVVSAIAKCWSTEAMRRVIDDAMDITGGAGICKGPRNTLAAAYQAVPIGITVEGANILTRTMIVFGQGAIRCHPFALKEMQAAAARDVKHFDAAFFGHVEFVFTNMARSLVLGLTGGMFASVPSGGRAAWTMKKLTRMSATFALLSDAAMGTLGGSLKRKEKITGRLADALAWMYIACAVVNRHVADGGKRDQAYFEWATAEALYNVQEALRGVLDNLPNRAAALALRPFAFPLGARLRPPTDRTTAACARAMIEGGEGRARLTAAMFVPGAKDPGLGRLERALELTLSVDPLRKKLRDAQKAKILPRDTEDAVLDEAVRKNVLTQAERDRVLEAWKARDDAIQVDDYAPGEYRKQRG